MDDSDSNIDDAEPVEPVAKKAKKTIETTPPSKVTWSFLEKNRLVTGKDAFLVSCAMAQKNLPDELQLNSWKFIESGIALLLKHGVRATEEFSMLIYGNLLACVTEELKSNLKFSVLPCVYKDESDCRRDKYCDYKLLTLLNEHT